MTAKYPVPHCKVTIERQPSLPRPGEALQSVSQATVPLADTRRTETIDAFQFDSRRHDFTCTAEYAKEDGESVGTLNMQLFGIDRKQVAGIPAGALVKVEGGVGGVLDVGNRTMFYGSLSHLLGSVRNGEYQWDLLATTSPTHFSFMAPRHTFEAGTRISAILDLLALNMGISITYPRTADTVALAEPYTTASGNLHEEVRIAAATLEAETGLKHSVSARPSSPFAIEIVNQAGRQSEGPPALGAAPSSAPVQVPLSPEPDTSPFIVDAIQVEVFSDYVMYGGTTLSTEEGTIGMEQLSPLSGLHQKFLEDPEGEMHFAEYNLETVFDPRIELDTVISVQENGHLFGLIPGVTSVRHVMGNIDNRGTSWTSTYKGPLADPRVGTTMVRTR